MGAHTSASRDDGTGRPGTDRAARRAAAAHAEGGRTSWTLAGAVVVCTDRRDGDMAPGSPDVERRRRAVVDLPWSVAQQVHGADVVVVDRPGGGAGQRADALVTSLSHVALAVVTADCAPVALVSGEGIVGVAHAGWRGLEAGVVQAAVGAMRALGATDVTAVLGPCIRADCYEFGREDLGRIAARLGPSVCGRHSAGAPGLDVAAAVAAALAEVGAQLADDAGICTACSDAHWSWRARSDRLRQATVCVASVSVEIAPGLRERLDEVWARIAHAGSGPDRVRLVAVTKGFGAEVVDAARGAGLCDLGENYAQELLAKVAVAGADRGGDHVVGPRPERPAGAPPEVCRWHFLGAPQRNKIAGLAPLVWLWQGIDRPEVVDRLGQVRPGSSVLVQVNVVGDPGKSGCTPSAAPPLVERARRAGLDVRGLMCVAPVGDLAGAQRAFAALASMGAALSLDELSMGMSDDFEAAVAEGSTMVRLGRVLFGPRPGPARVRR